MAENEAGVVEQGADQEQEAQFAYAVTVVDAGPSTKKVTVEIPRERITSKLDEQYKELRQQAAIPGFRVGHAPRKLLEKRFSDDVKDQVAGALVRESYQQALEKNSLQVIGEPDFESKDPLKLPEDGPLSYSFSVEVSPEFTIPDLGSLEVQKPKITVSEANVDQAMQNLREQQGVLVPVEDRGVQAGDFLTADVHLKMDGNVIAHQHDAQVVARAGRIGGIQIDDLGDQLAGMKPGETRTINTKAPETHSSEQVRGKDVQIEVALKDIKLLELAEITPAFLEDLGFDDEAGLREALREQMDEKIESDVQQAMREQVNRFLLEKTQLELPTKLTGLQTDRIVNRRAMDLMMRGIPREQVAANVEHLRAGAADEAGKELKLFFILQKMANDMEVEVTEGELNGRVAMMAAQRDERPEKLKQTMEKDGTLSSLYVQMREQKAVDKILEKATVKEVEMTPQQGEAAAAPASAATPETADAPSESPQA